MTDWLGTPNFTPGRTAPIRWVTLHSIVGTLDSAIASFANPARKASSTYGVSYQGDRVVQWVGEQDTPWTNGNESNAWSITIEHDDDGRPWDERPDGLYATSAALVADIRRRYSIVLVNGHRDTGAATACPAALDVARIATMAGGVPMISREEFDAWRKLLQKQLDETYTTKQEHVYHGHAGATAPRALARSAGVKVPAMPVVKPKRTSLARVRAGHGKG